MFTLFRYGLLPVVLFCVIVVVAAFDTFSTNAVREATWSQTVATVIESKDFGDALTKFNGTPNTFPDPHGTLKYVVGGKIFAWQGRGRDIGVTLMNPGDKIQIYYNRENPQEISTLILLGAATGSIILAVAIAFLVFYVWFFWIRGFLRRSSLDDFDESLADRVPELFADQIERSHSAPGDQHPAAIDKGARRSFGKRPSW